MKKSPNWDIQDVKWVDWQPNKRFATSSDLVFDKETGYIWPLNANPIEYDEFVNLPFLVPHKSWCFRPFFN